MKKIISSVIALSFLMLAVGTINNADASTDHAFGKKPGSRPGKK